MGMLLFYSFLSPLSFIVHVFIQHIGMIQIEMFYRIKYLELFYRDSRLRHLLHRIDRATIYIFISSSYTPW
jgi:predicted membrane channel-forming protein YqfA (hemolysin III family)